MILNLFLLGVFFAGYGTIVHFLINIENSPKSAKNFSQVIRKSFRRNSQYQK